MSHITWDSAADKFQSTMWPSWICSREVEGFDVVVYLAAVWVDGGAVWRPACSGRLAAVRRPPSSNAGQDHELQSALSGQTSVSSPCYTSPARPNPRFAKGAQQDLSRVKARFLCCRQSVFIWFFGILFGQMGQISGQGNFTHIRQGSFFAVCIWQGVEFKGILCTPVRFLWESE